MPQGNPRMPEADGPEETHRVIRGRRWRVSDPSIPEALRQLLVNELMSARRAVKAAQNPVQERQARDRVHDSKVALGERGLRWWERPHDPELLVDRRARARRALGRVPLPAEYTLDGAVDAVAGDAPERA